MTHRSQRRAILVAAAVTVALFGFSLQSWHPLEFAAGSPKGSENIAWIDALLPSARTAKIQEVMDRRAAAVRSRDRAAFLADVNPADADFLRKQEVVYDNLVQLPLAELGFHVEADVSYSKFIPVKFKSRFHFAVYAPGVTVRYRVLGIDEGTVAAPWVPILGHVDGRWVIVGQAVEPGLPYGANGQAWDAGPIVVSKSSRAVVVLSAEDAERGPYLLKLAEAGLDQVNAVRRDGWVRKVVVTAVQDQRIFEGYFAAAPDRAVNVAAIAVPYYDEVADWNLNPRFATTRVVFNPRQLSAQPEELAHDLVHEFTHAAMGPVTNQKTPRWLVEGFAEYVAYQSEEISATTLRRMLRDVRPAEALPADESFYLDARNYLTSWLACRMIVERYSEQTLITLYESFQERADQEANIASVLGVSRTQLTNQWRDYLQRHR